jgi:hypothetical protein
LDCSRAKVAAKPWRSAEHSNEACPTLKEINASSQQFGWQQSTPFSEASEQRSAQHKSLPVTRGKQSFGRASVMCAAVH